MSTGDWISIVVLGICVVLLLSAAHFSIEASSRAARIERFLAHLEHRVILIERNVQRDLLKDGVLREDLPHVHEILPPFKVVEAQMVEILRKSK